MAPVHHVTVAGSHVEVEELGAGEPVVVVQTALSIDELAPLAHALSAHFQVWHVHRPGYGAHARPVVRRSIADDADLVAAVTGELVGGPAHLVGASYSAAVLLTLASRHPGAVRSLALVEPPPFGTDAAADFRDATRGLVAAHAEAETSHALETIMRLVDGPGWRANAERDLPGSVAAMERDAQTFFESDLPALLAWTFTDADAAGLDSPVLLVGGSDSSRWFAEMLDRLGSVLPRSARTTIDGAGHTAALSHVDEVARVIRDHVRSVSPDHLPRDPRAGRS